MAKLTWAHIGVFILIVIVTIVVVTMTSDSMKNKGSKIIYFYRPGCPHCQRFNDQWDRFSELVPNDINVLKVNTELQPRLAQQFGVTSVPYIVKETSKGVDVYRGQRRPEALIQWARS